MGHGERRSTALAGVSFGAACGVVAMIVALFVVELETPTENLLVWTIVLTTSLALGCGIASLLTDGVLLDVLPILGLVVASAFGTEMIMILVLSERMTSEGQSLAVTGLGLAVLATVGMSRIVRQGRAVRVNRIASPVSIAVAGVGLAIAMWATIHVLLFAGLLVFSEPTYD